MIIEENMPCKKQTNKEKKKQTTGQEKAKRNTTN